jgi:hypothetical protein
LNGFFEHVRSSSAICLVSDAMIELHSSTISTCGKGIPGRFTSTVSSRSFNCGCISLRTQPPAFRIEATSTG